MKIYLALFCLLSISGLSFASGSYTPPPLPKVEKTKNKDNQKKGDKKKGNKKSDKDKNSKDNGNGGTP
jgi:hypothetical protein